MQQFGWTIGRNLRIDSRWPVGDSERFHSYAAELVALSPDVIVATGSAAAEPLPTYSTNLRPSSAGAQPYETARSMEGAAPNTDEGQRKPRNCSRGFSYQQRLVS